MEETLVRSRQAELVDSAIFTQPITLIGCGAIGSFTALTLAKMGFNLISVYDHDDVGEENIANQFYRYSDIGENKAFALGNMLKDFENIEILTVAGKWTRSNTLRGVVIMAVDSMTVRSLIYDRIKGNRGVSHFVDGRMGGQQADVYAFKNTPEQRRVYEQTLWTEDEAHDLPCTQKAVMYNVLWIASYIANTLRLMLEGKSYADRTLYDFENQEQHKLI